MIGSKGSRQFYICIMYGNGKIMQRVFSDQNLCQQNKCLFFFPSVCVDTKSNVLGHKASTHASIMK